MRFIDILRVFLITSLFWFSISMTLYASKLQKELDITKAELKKAQSSYGLEKINNILLGGLVKNDDKKDIHRMP